jgi:predicted dehydrogenase
MSIEDPEFGQESNDNSGVVTRVDGETIHEERLPNERPPTYSAFYNGLVAALKGTASVPVDPREAAQVIRIVNLARESSQSGQTLAV